MRSLLLIASILLTIGCGGREVVDDPETSYAGIADFFSFVNDKLEADQAGAIADVFANVVGLVGDQEAFGGANLRRHGLRPLAAQARDLLASGSITDEQRSRLAQGLGTLDIPQDVLDAYSRPATSPSPFRNVALQDNVACRTIWTEGFPPPGPEPIICFVYYEWLDRDGDAHRIYVPVEWEGDEAKELYFDAAADAIHGAEDVYGDWAPFGPSRIVFALLPDSDDPNTVASVPSTHSRPYCPVTIFGNFEIDAVEDFAQSVAHEYFHCFQDTAIGVTTNYRTAKWWIEGAAEYFSNTVYPSTNDEQGSLSDFESAINTVALVDMSYESNVFFQYLENRLGSPGAVFDLVRTLPPGGSRPGQMAALGGLPDAANVFQEFAQAYLDKAITDSGGGALPIGPFEIPRDHLLDGANEATLEAAPFTFGRYRVNYVEGDEYDIAITSGSVAGNQGTHPPGETGGWEPYPNRIEAGCSEQELSVVITSVAPVERDLFRLFVTPTLREVEEDECDECVIGKWVVNTEESLSPAVFGSMLSDDFDFRLVSNSGNVFLSLHENGRVEQEADNFETLFASSTSSGEVRSRIRINGSMEGNYVLSNGTITLDITTSITEASASVEVPIVGVMADEPFDLDGLMEELIMEPATYSCEGDRLEIQTPTSGGALFGPLYSRVSDDPPS